MFITTFDSESSSDPILDVIQTDPETIFGRPFAGFILLLFGALDEDIATWFARALVSLDSLTGEDIACTIFASKVKVNSANSKYAFSGNNYLFSGNNTNKNKEISLDCIHRRSASYLVKDGESQWHDSVREITAVTYAADIVAKRFGVINKLPCMIILDAIPKSRCDFLSKKDEKLVIPLSNYTSKDLIQILRNSIQTFRDKPNFQAYLKNLQSIAEIPIQTRQLENKISSLKEQMTKLKKNSILKLNKGIINISNIRLSVVQGSKRLLNKSLIDFPYIEDNVKKILYSKAQLEFQNMVKYNRTISALNFRINQRETVYAGSKISSLQFIFEKYVQPIINTHTFFSLNPTSVDCEKAVEIIKSQQSCIVDFFAEFIPSELYVERLISDELEELCIPLKENLFILEEQLKLLNNEYDTIVTEFIADEPPSLIEVMSKVLNPKSQTFNHVDNLLKYEWDFFIAHSGADTEIAELLYRNLILDSRVYLDSFNLKYGDNWDVELSKAQHMSKVTLILITPRTEDAYYQREEIASAINLSRITESHRVVPIFVGKQTNNIPYGLRLKHSIYLDDIHEIKNIKHKLLELVS